MLSVLDSIFRGKFNWLDTLLFTFHLTNANEIKKVYPLTKVWWYIGGFHLFYFLFYKCLILNFSIKVVISFGILSAIIFPPNLFIIELAIASPNP